MPERGGHNPEVNAATYVGGEMRKRQRRRFEAHLLACEECWREVQLDREGMRRAEALRELAPATLRDDVRAAILLSDTDPGWRPKIAFIGIGTVLVVFGGAALFFMSLRGEASQPAPISAALASYRARSVPISDATRSAPLLDQIGLTYVRGGHGTLAGLSVDTFEYRDGGGRDVFLFVSSSAFPAATGADLTAGMTAGWRGTSDGLTMICRSHPLSYLLVGDDPELIQRADDMLSMGSPPSPQAA